MAIDKHTVLVIGYLYCYHVFAEYNCGRGHTKCKDNLQCVAERLFCDSLPFKRKRKWFYDCIDKSDEDLDFCKGNIIFI